MKALNDIIFHQRGFTIAHGRQLAEGKRDQDNLIKTGP